MARRDERCNAKGQVLYAEGVRTMSWGLRPKRLDLNGKDNENRVGRENARANKELDGRYSGQKRRRTDGDTQRRFRQRQKRWKSWSTNGKRKREGDRGGRDRQGGRR